MPEHNQPDDPTEPSNAVWGAQPPVADQARPRIATWKKVAGGVVLAAVIGGGGVAAVSAANAANGTTTAAVAGPGGMAGYDGGQGFAGGQGAAGGERTPGGGGMGGFGAVRELAGALHGDFVTSTDAGGTQAMRLQNGAVTAIAAGSLTVNSTDGYTGTYVLGSDVDVSGIAVGDEVTVLATVDADTATATTVTTAQAAGTGSGMRPGGTDPAPAGEPAPTTAAPQTS